MTARMVTKNEGHTRRFWPKIRWVLEASDYGLIIRAQTYLPGSNLVLSCSHHVPAYRDRLIGGGWRHLFQNLMREELKREIESA